MATSTTSRASCACARASRSALYASGAILAVLASNPIFNVLDPRFVARHRLVLEEPVAVAPGLTVLPFAVPGKVALYLEDGQPAVGAETEDTIGLELHDPGGARVCFVPGCARVTPALAARLAGADLLLFDGTLWTDDEMIRSRTGVKTGLRMGHISVSGPDGSLAALREVSARAPDLSAHQQHQPDPARGFARARRGRGRRLGGRL